jgi:hypothetical protein
MPTEPTINLTETLGEFMSLPDVMLLLFLLATGIYVIYSAIFYYHWQQYGVNTAVTWITFVTYAATTLPLFLVMAGLTLTF